MNIYVCITPGNCHGGGALRGGRRKRRPEKRLRERRRTLRRSGPLRDEIRRKAPFFPQRQGRQ
jgi:hypothetical protein